MKGQKFYSRMWTLLFALFLGSMCMAQSADKQVKIPPGIEKVTTVEGITEYQLKDNGVLFR